MELNIFEVLGNKEIEKMNLADVFFLCALLLNFMYGSYVTRYVPSFHLNGHPHVIISM